MQIYKQYFNYPNSLTFFNGNRTFSLIYKVFILKKVLHNMFRRVADIGELFDLLDQIRNGAWISFGYVSKVEVNDQMPTKKIRNQQTNRMNTVKDLAMFSSDGEDLATLVKVSNYNIQYRNRALVAKQYGEYLDKANPIRVSYGLPPIQRKDKDYTEKMNFGNGVDVYNGKREELQGHSYLNLNVFGVKPKVAYYAVNSEGRIVKEIPRDQLKPYLKSKSVDGAEALKKLGAEDETVKEYIQKIAELKYTYGRYVHESILWVAATTKTGDKFVYINENLNKTIDKINVNPQDFLAIANERYKIGMADIEDLANKNVQESRNMKQLIRLTESDLHRIINESVNRIISESIKRTKHIK